MKVNSSIKLFCLLAFPTIASGQTNADFGAFIPEDYTTYGEAIYGDLNRDSLADAVVLIKGTDTAGFRENQFGDIVDKNRRGILIFFNTGNGYTLALQNHDCFSSENEDGGVYYAPVLSVHACRGNLYFHYEHGRYGYWKYTFRFQNNDFELIGYDATSHFGPLIRSGVSINFLTKRMMEFEDVNPYTEESGDEIFEETWSDITIDKLFKLSEIDDVDWLDLSAQTLDKDNTH